MSLFSGKKKVTDARNRIIDFKRTYGSSEGKRTLIELMNRYHILNEHDGDPYKEGQRSVILYIMKQVNISLEKFDKVMAEGEIANDIIERE